MPTYYNIKKVASTSRKNYHKNVIFTIGSVDLFVNLVFCYRFCL